MTARACVSDADERMIVADDDQLSFIPAKGTSAAGKRALRWAARGGRFENASSPGFSPLLFFFFSSQNSNFVSQFMRGVLFSFTSVLCPVTASLLTKVNYFFFQKFDLFMI